MPWTIETTAIRNITPISTPMSENTLLSFCVHMLRSAIMIASNACTLGRLTPIEPVAFDPPILEDHDPFG